MNQNKVKNPAAVALGKLGAGKPKNYSKEELARRTARLKGLKKTLLVAALAGCALAANAKADVVEVNGYFVSDQDTGKITQAGNYQVNTPPALSPARKADIAPVVHQPGRESGLLAIGFILLAAAGIFVYFIPAMIARGKRNAGAIFVLNLLAGWSFIGWVGALVWACTKDPKAEGAQTGIPA
jgi:hypothetical protein